jgi:beta-galactosidase
LGHDGQPGRRYREAAQVAAEYRRLAPRLAGTTVRAEVAVIYDYDSLWALEIQGGYPGAAYQEAVKRYYQALLRAGVNVDIVRPGDELKGYKLVLAPHLHVLPDEVAGKLVKYVQDGGVLLADCRTAVKDATNLAHERTLPGLLAPALGIRIDEYESLRLGIETDEETEYKLIADKLGGQYTATKQADWIEPTDAEALAAYDEPHLKDFAAVTRFSRAGGAGWYVGTVVKEEQFYDKLMARVLQDAGVEPLVNPPNGVEASLRTGDDARLLFLVNHTKDSKKVSLDGVGKATDLLEDKPAEEEIELAPFGVAVLELSD